MGRYYLRYKLIPVDKSWRSNIKHNNDKEKHCTINSNLLRDKILIVPTTKKKKKKKMIVRHERSVSYYFDENHILIYNISTSV